MPTRLIKELARGDRAAKELVRHLFRMGHMAGPGSVSMALTTNTGEQFLIAAGNRSEFLNRRVRTDITTEARKKTRGTLVKVRDL